MAKSSGSDRKARKNSQPKNIDPVEVKDVFNDISLINTTTNTISSLGTYASNLSIQISDDKIREIKSLIPEGSLAYKILNDDRNFNLRRGFSFSDKQRWVVAYELMKNKKYTNRLGEEKYKNRINEESKRIIQNTKLKSNKSASQPYLDMIKQNKKKLGDYYKWLNNRDNKYRKEYFSKKYSLDSVKAFLNT